MELNKIIKKYLLKEVAGISFEVRMWAQIIENYVKDYIQSEKEKIKTQQPVSYQPTQPKSTSWSAPEEDDFEYDLEFTHFEDDEGNVYEKANIYADELYINSDILEDYPGIKGAISGKLFTVTLNGEGKFFVQSAGGSFPETFRVGIEELIADHMTLTEPFYTDDYTNVYATSNDFEYGDYMSEAEEDKYKSFYGGYYQQPKIDKIEINSKDFPEAYEKFKVDKWVITPSNRIEYDHWKSGYDESGQYVVYLNMPLYSVGGSALVHEVKHAYDDWNRMSRGAQPIRSGWEIQNIYTPDFEKLVLGGSYKLSPMIHPIIRYYYLGSKLESPAYLENEYDSPVMGSYRDTAKKLMNFKASNFLDKKGNPAKGLQESWSELIRDYNIPFFRKFKNVVDFLNYTERYFNKRGREILRRIDKMKYIHGKPMTTQAPPKVYTKPEETKKELPKWVTQQLSDEVVKLDKQIDKLEDEWDRLYDLDSKKYGMDLDELEIIIKGLIEKRNKLAKSSEELNGDLPF
jgi:hypothetical protein